MSIFGEIVDWFHELLGGTGSSDLADLGADPHDVVAQHGAGTAQAAGEFPNASGSSVIDQVNQSVSKATESYHEGMDIAEHAPHMPSAGQQAQELIHGTMNASPEQLSHMENTLGGMNAADEIHNSVAESQQHLLDENARHEALKAADSELIHAKSVTAAAADAADEASDSTGT